MGTKPTFDNVSTAVGDPQFLHNWKLNVIKFPNVGNYPDPEAINWKCTTSDLPTSSSVNTSLVIRGQTLHFASGIVKYSETLNLNFVEDTDGTVRDFLRELREACTQFKTGKGNKKADYVGLYELVTLDNDQNTDNWRILLVNAFYETSNLQSLESGANASIMTPTLTLRYDIFDDGKAS